MRNLCQIVENEISMVAIWSNGSTLIQSKLYPYSRYDGVISTGVSPGFDTGSRRELKEG